MSKEVQPPDKNIVHPSVEELGVSDKQRPRNPYDWFPGLPERIKTILFKIVDEEMVRRDTQDLPNPRARV